MITILNKKNCCGCSACIQICPKRCITMIEDEEGFSYPSVNMQDCIDCHLCEHVCPVLNQGQSHDPLEIYAAKNNDDKIRMDSSSGGIFTVLAEKTIEENGVVFGARFNEKWEVIHDYAETKEGVAAFRGSKYVQSLIGNTYKEAETFLRQGRKVLFSGTPCQIRGLKLFLRKEYDNLLTVDFICHGVPSPKVWKEYLEEIKVHASEKNSVLPRSIMKKKALIESISFRNKRLGWKRYSFSLTLSTTEGSGEKDTVFLSEPLDKNIFLRGFMSNLFLRPSCHACKCREFRSGSDITIADCWGLNKIYPDFDDDKGCSLYIVKNENLSDIMLLLTSLPVKQDFVRTYNRSCYVSDAMPANRSRFFESIKEGGVSKHICNYATFPDKSMKAVLVKILDKISLLSITKTILKKI